MDRYTVTGRLREMLRSSSRSCLTAARMKEALAVLRAVSSLHAAAEQQSSHSLPKYFEQGGRVEENSRESYTAAGRALGAGGVRCEERAFPTPCDG